VSAVAIRLSGCDDNTYFVLDLTAKERAVAERIATASKQASQLGCQPTMTVEEVTPDD
jgi:hypothetical protein